MKKLMMMLSVVLLAGATKAQQVEPLQNGGFEQWDTLDGYQQPRDWYTLNALTSFGFDPTTEMTDDAHTGNYAVKLVSKKGPFGNLSGVLTSGPILNEALEPTFENLKFAFNKLPTAFRFYYKSNFLETDSAIGTFVLTKWNTITKTADTIATTDFSTSKNFNTYQEANIPFQYLSTQTPDSAFFIITSSADGFNPTIGSTIYLDDLALVYGTNNIKNASLQNSLLVFPNPAQTVINLSNSSELGSIKVFNHLGQIVFSTVETKSLLSIDMTEFAKGLYFIEIENNAGKLVKKVVLN
ncbi:MAG: T9SS type A sorting domain-containing protein [Bacteroidia bacterium]|nr:T9SS type A sorting domain-containing protein [Bacteroidia bacterium]